MRNGLTKRDNPAMGMLDPLFRMRTEMDRMMESFFGTSTSEEESPMTGGNFFSTRLNTSEDSKNYYLELELPGVKRDDVDISLQDGNLLIEGTRVNRRESGDDGSEPKKFHRVESSYGHFRRSMKLPSDAQEDQISAKFEDGILCVTIPRGMREDARKRIQIQG